MPAKQPPQADGEGSSDSDSSSSEEEEEEEKTSKAPVKKKPQKAAGGVAPSKPASVKQVKAESSSSSSSDDSSEEEEEKPKGKGTPKPQVPKANGTSALTAAQNGKAGKDSEEEEEEKAAVAVSKPGKKRKQNEAASEAGTPQAKKIKVQTPNTFPKRKKGEKRASSPFRRVREEEIEVDSRVADNSFDAKRGAVGDWGERANQVLKFTKGKSFRHEKTKKKRGSYRGGSISVQVNSVKFDSE